MTAVLTMTPLKLRKCKWYDSTIQFEIQVTLFRRPESRLPSRTPSQSQVPEPSMQKTRDAQTAQPTWPARPAVPIRVPSQTDRLLPSKPAVPYTHPELEDIGDEEVVNIPDFHNDNTVLSPAEAEKALRDLMSGTMNQDLDSDIDIDMSQEIVDGFKEGIKLLPHQIIGRAWMKDREDLSKKRTGGILADDMGYNQMSFSGIISVNLFFFSLGKTIQTLTRIVEGRAKRTDKEAGWSASTL